MTRFYLMLLLAWCCANGWAAGVDPQKNLKNYIKLSSTLNPNNVTISYINGTVYSVQPGQRSIKLFYFEGFNIGRKVPTANGDYRSFSCELVVYRDPVSGKIVQTWENPLTLSLNEVFVVQNYPVNAFLSEEDVPTGEQLTDKTVVFNSDIPLRYPNPLPPDQYPKYSAGPYYIGAEFFEYFGRQKELADNTKDSVNATVTWNRISQWLPWMELGQAKGNLFYAAFAWKIPSFNDFPEDILKLLQNKYPKFFKPPSDFNIPNETTWKVFKKIVTERRNAGLPDIILGPDIVTPNTTQHRSCLDSRLESVLLRQAQFQAAWSGKVYSFTGDQQSVNLFHVRGDFLGRLRPYGVDFVLDLTVNGEFLDTKSGDVLKFWFNPFTNETVSVPTIQFSKSVTLLRDDVVSFPIPPSKEIGLSVITSRGDEEDWYTNSCMIVFSQNFLSPNATLPVSYYGTYASISSWLPWMKMHTIPGYMAFRMNVLPNIQNLYQARFFHN